MMNSLPADLVEDINRICRYLALDDFDHQPICAQALHTRLNARKFDVIVVFGNQVLATLLKACDLLTGGLADRLLLTGGFGHSTHLLFRNIAESPRYGHLATSGMVSDQMSEADMFAVIAAAEAGVPRSRILIENKSTNTGENARFSLELIRGMRDVSSVLLIQDPIMQRRTALTMSQAARRLSEPPLLLSHSVFVPQVYGGYSLTPPNCDEQSPWDETRFLSMVLGEIERIRNDEQGYGPRGRGFIAAEDIPKEVLESYESVIAHASGR